MQVSHLNNMGFLGLKYQFFIPAKVMVQKFETLHFILIILAIFQNFYKFLAIIIWELQLDKLLQCLRPLVTVNIHISLNYIYSYIYIVLILIS